MSDRTNELPENEKVSRGERSESSFRLRLYKYLSHPERQRRNIKQTSPSVLRTVNQSDPTTALSNQKYFTVTSPSPKLRHRRQSTTAATKLRVLRQKTRPAISLLVDRIKHSLSTGGTINRFKSDNTKHVFAVVPLTGTESPEMAKRRPRSAVDRLFGRRNSIQLSSNDLTRVPGHFKPIAVQTTVHERSDSIDCAEYELKSTGESQTSGGSSLITQFPLKHRFVGAAANLDHRYTNCMFDRKSTSTGGKSAYFKKYNSANSLFGTLETNNNRYQFLSTPYQHSNDISGRSPSKSCGPSRSGSRRPSSRKHSVRETTAVHCREFSSNSAVIVSRLNGGSVGKATATFPLVRKNDSKLQILQSVSVSPLIEGQNAATPDTQSSSPATSDRPSKLDCWSNDQIIIPQLIDLQNRLGLQQPIEAAVNQYAVIKEIGEGSLSKVSLVYNIEDGRYYACKSISKKRLRNKSMWSRGPAARNKSTLAKTQIIPDSNNHPANNQATVPAAVETACVIKGYSYLEMVKKEISILKKLSKHPNIATLVEVLDDCSQDTLYMILELCEYGAIMKLQVNCTVPYFPESLARHYFRDIILGLEYCTLFFFIIVVSHRFIIYHLLPPKVHSMNIIHRDLKPENILLTGNNRAVIGDFSISLCSDPCQHQSLLNLGGSSVFTPLFTPPELLKPESAGSNNGISPALDMWSLGVSLFCFLHGCVPFSGQTTEEVYNSITAAPIAQIIRSDMTKALKNLLMRLLDKDPVTRISIPEIRNDPWVTNAGKDPLLPDREENCFMMP